MQDILTANVNIKKETRTEGFSKAPSEFIASHKAEAETFSNSCLFRSRNSSTVLVLMRVPTAEHDHFDDDLFLRYECTY